MATYLPGVQDYIPNLEPFKPDYKFLSDVLTIRQDRYDTNFRSLNNLYNDVVNAPLTREENIERRDQYANRLTEGLKQIAGLDLSLQQNVDAAKGLFRPFYDDQDIRKDMAFTKRVSDQMEKANFYFNSPNPEDNNKWWQIGVDRLNMHIDDFKNATTQGARNMGLPSYVDNPNYFERAFESLKASGLTFEQTTPNGDWMITTTNGTALTNRIIGYELADNGKDYKLDRDGEPIPITVDDTFNYLKNTMLTDPKVQLGMQTEAYVNARNFATNPDNIAEYGSEQNAYEFWAQDYINQAVDAGIMDLSEAESLENNLEGEKKSWEEYKQKYNIIPGSPSENIIMQKAFELDLAKKNKDLIQRQVQTLKAPANDLDKLLSTAYQAYSILTVGPKLKEAGSAYSRIGAKQTFKVNELAKLKKQQDFQWALEGFKAQNRLNEIALRGAEARKTAKYSQDLKNIADGLTGSIYDSFKDAKPKAFDFKNYNEDLAENIEKQEFNILDKMQIDRNDQMSKIDLLTNDFILKIGSMSDEFQNSPYVVPDSLGTQFRYPVVNNTATGSDTIYKTGSVDDLIKDYSLAVNETNKDAFVNHFRAKVDSTLTSGYRSVIPGDPNGPIIEQDILLNSGSPIFNQKPQAYMSLVNILGALDVEKGLFVNAEKEYNRILKNLQSENVTDNAVNQKGFPPLVQTEKQLKMGLNGESISSILSPNTDGSGRYNNYSDSTYVIVDKETFADQVVAMATNDGNIQDVLDYLNKNHKYAVFSTKAQPGRITKEYSFNDRDKIDIFEKNPLLAQSFFWEEQPSGDGFPLGLGIDNNPGTWVFAPYATRRTMIGSLLRDEKSNDEKIEALRELAYEIYDGESSSDNAEGEERLSDADNVGMLQNLQILMREGDAPGKYSFNYKDFISGNLPQMGQDVKLDPIMDAYFDNTYAKYQMVDGERVPTDATHFLLNMAEVLRSRVPGKDWQASIPKTSETGFGADVNALINDKNNIAANQIMEQMIDYLLMAQKNDTRRSIFDISWSKTGSNELGPDGDYSFTAYKLQPNVQSGPIIEDMLGAIVNKDGISFGEPAETLQGNYKVKLSKDGLEAYQKIMTNGIVMYMRKDLDQNRNMDSSYAVDQLAKYIMTTDEQIYKMQLPNAGTAIIEHIGGGQFKARVQDYKWSDDALAVVPAQIIPDERIYRADEILELKAALEQYMINVATQNIADENAYKKNNL
tara:strand:- start:9980 stop:13624 length:3645 start_codon:yes stop_codon:yes gene_type:complete